MSVPKLSQTALYEVLVCEVESLKTTKREYDKTLKEIGVHLTRLEALYKEPIAVNVEDMQVEHVRIQSTLRRGLYIPKWLFISLFSLFLALLISLFFNYRQYATSQKQLEYIRKADSYTLELEEKLPKSKSRK